MEIFYICFIRQSNICPNRTYKTCVFSTLRHPVFPSVPYSVTGVLIRPKESQFRRQFDVTILFIFCRIETEIITCAINAPYPISSQRVSVSAACVGHDSRYISYLNAFVCTQQMRLDTYKPNLYWYSVVYCGSHCLAVCLSFCLSLCPSVCLSV